jgi:predicted aspartyl protease
MEDEPCLIEVLTALESAQLYSMQDDCYLSLHAMSGHPQGKAIQLRALVQNQVMVILVDSSSSHTFLNAPLAHKLKVATTLIPQMIVNVANGQSLSCATEVKQFAWWIQGHTFQVDAKVIEMGAYDLVLGIDWLELYRPIMCD